MITLKRGRIVGQWPTVLEPCQGQAEGMLQAIEGNLQKHNAPNRTGRRERVACGWPRGVFGKRRDLLPNPARRLPASGGVPLTLAQSGGVYSLHSWPQVGVEGRA